MASRMPVSAAWMTAARQDSIEVTTRAGSIAFYQRTALTLTATPSRVIVSWVSSWTVMVRVPTLTTRSMNGINQYHQRLPQDHRAGRMTSRRAFLEYSGRDREAPQHSLP